MAGEATIGALRVVLGADTAKFQENLQSALGDLQKFGADVLKIATGINVAKIAEQAVEALKTQFEAAIAAGDALAKASEKFGIPVETLSALSAAASLSDISLEQLGQSLSRLSRNMIAAQAPTSAQTSAFKALGVSVKDSSGQFKSADQILLQVADSFSKFQDGTTKTALAVAIFGKAGADLIPMLNKGSDGIRELQARMEDLGLVIDTRTAKAAERLTDDWQFLTTAKTNLILKIAGSSGLIDALDKLVVSLTNAAKYGGDLSNILYDGARSLTNFSVYLGAAKSALDDFADGLNAINEATALVAKGDFAGAFEVMNAALERSKTNMAAIAETIGSTVPTVSEGILGASRAVDDLNKNLAKAPDFNPDRDKKLEAFRKDIEKINAQAQEASGIFAGRLAPGFLAAAAGMEILKGQVKIGADGLVTLGLLAEQLNQAMLRLQGAKIVADNLPVWDQFAIKLKNADDAMRAYGATDEQVLAEHVRLSGEAAAATSSFFGFLAQGSAAAASQNKGFASLAKGLAIAQATINTYEAATKAFNLFGGWPLGAAAAAATVAAGLGLVAKISAQQFAAGGSFTVPGGVSGVDNTLVPLALASGERVDITPAGKAASGGGRVPTIEIGMSMSDFLQGNNMRDLVANLNAAHRDGYRLKLVER